MWALSLSEKIARGVHLEEEEEEAVILALSGGRLSSRHIQQKTECGWDTMLRLIKHGDMHRGTKKARSLPETTYADRSIYYSKR